MTKHKTEDWCYLIDLERSLQTGIVHYWKPFNLGYTTNFKDAGTYPESIAKKMQESDVNKTTIAILESVAYKVINHE